MVRTQYPNKANACVFQVSSEKFRDSLHSSILLILTYISYLNMARDDTVLLT